jgi:hypothetical protein
MQHILAGSRSRSCSGNPKQCGYTIIHPLASQIPQQQHPIDLHPSSKWLTDGIHRPSVSHGRHILRPSRKSLISHAHLHFNRTASSNKNKNPLDCIWYGIHERIFPALAVQNTRRHPFQKYDFLSFCSCPRSLPPIRPVNSTQNQNQKSD